MNERIVLSLAVTLCTALCGDASAQALSANDRALVTSVDDLVQQAVSADKAGDPQLREALLEQAIEVDSDHELARWLMGQVQFGNKWKSVEEVQELVANDGRWAEYRRRVGQADDSLSSQLALAHWCRRAHLEREEQWHWQQVLELAPNHPEALKRLELERHQGELYTKAELNELREDKRAFGRHKPTFDRLVRNVFDDDDARRDEALAELAAVDEPTAVTALVEAIRMPDPQKRALIKHLGQDKYDLNTRLLHEAGVKALAKVNNYDSTVRLVEVAIYSNYESVRHLAAEALVGRPKTDYMPLLMAGMKPPLKLSIDRDFSPTGGVSVKETLSEVGRKADREIVRTSDYLTSSRFTREETGQSWVQYDTREDLRKSGQHIERTEQWLATENRIRQRNNQRIQEALKILTGLDLNADAERWWATWKEYNELEGSLEKPVYKTAQYENYHDYEYYFEPMEYEREPYYRPASYSRPAGGGDKRYYPSPERYPDGDSRNGPRYGSSAQHGPVSRIVPEPPPPPRRRSCFVAGTPVWTQSGPKPVEQIEAGEFVLSQDPVSGRLDYRPVLETTVRPPSPVSEITIDGETITATLGHRFWVTGHGWRMAKFLQPGYRLYSVQGSTEILSLEDGTDTEAFNLVVADFHTYFVGNHQLLVHDNSIPEHSLTVVPGVELTPEASGPAPAVVR